MHKNRNVVHKTGRLCNMARKWGATAASAGGRTPCFILIH